MRFGGQLVAVLLVFALRAIPAEVLQLDIDNVIHPVTFEMVADAVDQARARGSTLLLIRLNTPGGLMEASREVVEKLIASPAPVVTWVAPSGARAASAGFFVLLAGDVSAMAPGTHTGAASPVMLGRELDPIMRRKVESDAGAWLRSIASRRGRNAALAEKAVSEAKSFTEQEALDSNLIDLIAKDETELLSRLDGTLITRINGTKQILALRNAKVVVYQLSLRQKILKAVSDPNIALVVLLLGVLGLYVEFSTPGLIFPGVAGAILLLLGLSAMALLPLSWLGSVPHRTCARAVCTRGEVHIIRGSGSGWGSGNDPRSAFPHRRTFGVPYQSRDRHRNRIAIRRNFRVPHDARYTRPRKQGADRSMRVGRRDRHRAHGTEPRRKNISPRRVLERGKFNYRHRGNTSSRAIG